jgi:hypothetical protein
MIGGHIASRFGHKAWPARSPYLSERYYVVLGPLESPSIGQQTLNPRNLKEHTRDEITASEKVSCEHLWLLSDHDYRNLLHDRETNYEM